MFDYSKKISLKYTDDVPENYDVSQIEFTFDFIYLVLKRGSDIDSAIKGVVNEYYLSRDYLYDYLIENIYILNKTNRYQFSKQIKNYNTKSLRKLLKTNGYDASGRRKRLEERIYKHKLIDLDYYLSSKSKIFYKNKKRRVKIFENDLFDYYYFNEFNDFYMNNFRKKEAKIPVEFIKLHIDKSIEDENHEKYIINNFILANHYYKKENYKKMLRYVLKTYCMNLNPIWNFDNLKNHDGLLKETYNALIFLQRELSRNTVISTYYLVWDSFNFEKQIMTKYEGYKYLKEILNLKDYSKITSDLKNRFYNNENVKIKKITQKSLFDF